jgi:glycerol uptake facilitator-like aquaporin
MSLTVRSGAELIGTALLVAIVVGSGIMAEQLTQDSGVALLLNQLATILGLGTLIVVLMPISGAHFNPVVTLAFLVRGEISIRETVVFVLSQLLGGLAGTGLAHVMFGAELVELSTNNRLSLGTGLAEVVATAGLVATIVLLVSRSRESIIPLAVPAWIGAAYIFTSSTSFANPAVTVARMFTDSFSGISPPAALGFIGAQFIGLAVSLALIHPVTRTLKEPIHVR